MSWLRGRRRGCLLKVAGGLTLYSGLMLYYEFRRGPDGVMRGRYEGEVSALEWLAVQAVVVAGSAMILAGVVVGYRQRSLRGVWRERYKAGLCAKCGYDLRGNAERCPECGRRTSRRLPLPHQ